MNQNSPIIRSQDSWKLSDYTCASIILTNYGCEGHAVARNGNTYVIKIGPSWLKNREMKWTYFWRVLTIWKHSESNWRENSKIASLLVQPYRHAMKCIFLSELPKLQPVFSLCVTMGFNAFLKLHSNFESSIGWSIGKDFEAWFSHS